MQPAPIANTVQPRRSCVCGAQLNRPGVHILAGSRDLKHKRQADIYQPAFLYGGLRRCRLLSDYFFTILPCATLPSSSTTRYR